jgi:Glycosyl transferase family 2
MPTPGTMNVAPIAMFVYNRLHHTRQSIEALAGNELASDSELFVFSDGPRTDADGEKVESLRSYLKTIKGFKSVTVVEREKNLGCAQSIITGVTEIVNRYGWIIVVEDDIVTAPFFLRYMNEALEFYRDEEKVVCIHGYLYPVRKKLPETFFLRGADIWGWGTWKRGWNLYEPDGKKLLTELRERNLTREFNFDDSFDFTQMLERQGEGSIDTWDIQWYASAFLLGKLTLYPGRSLVRNIGTDNSGTHSGSTDIFFTKLSNIPVKIRAIPVEEDATCRKEIGRFHKFPEGGLIERVLKILRAKVKG